MGRRSHAMRYYRHSRPYTSDRAKDELMLALGAGILLIPLTLGFSLLAIPLVAMKGAVLAESESPNPQDLELWEDLL
jgi:hypothetical protein